MYQDINMFSVLKSSGVPKNTFQQEEVYLVNTLFKELRLVLKDFNKNMLT